MAGLNGVSNDIVGDDDAKIINRKQCILSLIYILFYLSGLTLLPVGKWTVIWLVLHVGTVDDELVLAHELLVRVAVELGEAPSLRDVDLLSAWVLELGTTKSLNNLSLVLVLGAHAHERLTNVDTSDRAQRLTEGAAHTSLQAIGACAGQHLVDAQNVERVHTHTDVESILTAVLDQVLVGADTGCLKSLRRKLLVLVRNQVHAKRELVDAGSLATQVKDTDLWVWDTSTMSRLWIWLILAISVASSRTPAHSLH